MILTNAICCLRSWLGQRMQFDGLKRREFITVLAGAAAWPLTAQAQQPAIPVVGFMHILSPENVPRFVPTFQQGLKEQGWQKLRLRGSRCISINGNGASSSHWLAARQRRGRLQSAHRRPVE